jgi:hypothetical protein
VRQPLESRIEDGSQSNEDCHQLAKHWGTVRLGTFQGSSAWHWIGAINKQAMARIGSTKQTYITLCMAPYWLPIYIRSCIIYLVHHLNEYDFSLFYHIGYDFALFDYVLNYVVLSLL